MRYTEFVVDENGAAVMVDGKPQKLDIDARIRLLEEDLNDLVLPSVLPTAHQVMEYMRDAQLVNNNLRKLRRAIVDSLTKWEMRVDRLQRGIGGYKKLGVDGKEFSDTGEIRKDLRKLVSACWGPAQGNVADPDAGGGMGLKSGLLPIEDQAARQLAKFLIPNWDESEELPLVALSFDDVIERKSAHKRRLDAIEKDLESRHYDVNNVVKMMELEGFASNRAINGE